MKRQWSSFYGCHFVMFMNKFMKGTKHEELLQTQAPCSLHRFVKAVKHHFPLLIIENSYLSLFFRRLPINLIYPATTLHIH